MNNFNTRIAKLEKSTRRFSLAKYAKQMEQAGANALEKLHKLLVDNQGPLPEISDEAERALTLQVRDFLTQKARNHRKQKGF